MAGLTTRAAMLLLVNNVLPMVEHTLIHVPWLKCYNLHVPL